MVGFATPMHHIHSANILLTKERARCSLHLRPTGGTGCAANVVIGYHWRHDSLAKSRQERPGLRRGQRERKSSQLACFGAKKRQAGPFLKQLKDAEALALEQNLGLLAMLAVTARAVRELEEHPDHSARKLRDVETFAKRDERELRGLLVMGAGDPTTQHDLGSGVSIA
ncbi:hypothetical protein OE88DRAFT_1648262 [Heliocybe sulcata]|uniref:Uncharacterized protein n=1 Tax=Heliocybe sulcata TaxID=5364 RepID=A0A5C3MSL2_9AGAM|nr:hypothetical protein OE88DRAFT_1648262 [Heliocybe sulcata]